MVVKSGITVVVKLGLTGAQICGFWQVPYPLSKLKFFSFVNWEY